jgi:CRP-like cAMP-binding protein
MRKALYILGQLNDRDVDWLAQHGTRQRLSDGEIIVSEGKPLDTLFIILSGKMRVTLQDGHEVVRLGAGEVVGEIAFVDSAPASATVIAAGDAVVFSLARTQLQRHLDADPPFAARFYRALAVFLADRLRATTYRLGYGAAAGLDSDAVLEDELDPSVLDTVAQAGERFTRLLQTLSAQ